MPITDDDIQKLKQARNIINSVKEHIDCHYCQSHMDILANMMDDVIDISKFNLLYSDDRALENLRKMLTHESTLRLLSVASRLVGFFRRIKYKHW